jgi:hypothetical protein
VEGDTEGTLLIAGARTGGYGVLQSLVTLLRQPVWEGTD